MDKRHTTQKHGVESSLCYACTTPTKINVEGKNMESIRKKTEVVKRRKHHRTC